MLRPRIVPSIEVLSRRAVKTTKFRRPAYVGDPVNAIGIYNESEVDEVLILDIGATLGKYGIDYDFLARLADSAFSPCAYGGGVSSLEEVAKIIGLGFEKVVIGSGRSKQNLISSVAAEFGSQTVIASVNVSDQTLRSRLRVQTCNYGEVDEVLRESVDAGAGEVLLTSVRHEGTGAGVDRDLLDLLSVSQKIPVLYRGGIRSFEEACIVSRLPSLSGVVLGRTTTYQNWPDGILVHFPSRVEITMMMRSVEEKLD